MEDQTGPALGPRSELEIGVFSVIPSYADALRIASVNLTYDLLNPGEETTDARLVMKVGLNGRALEEVVLFSGNVTSAGAKNGSMDYLPSSGWAKGNYTFHAELYSGGSLIGSTADQSLEVQTEQPATVSWYVLALIIGASAVAAAVTTVLVLRRRRELVKAWTGEGRPLPK